MAKQKKEKVIIKGLGLVSFVIALVLFIVACWGNSIFTNEDNAILGLTMNDVAKLLEDFENISPDFKTILSIIFVFICAIISIILMIKFIGLFFGLLGFIGKKDAYVVAKKLSKYAKNALGAMAIEIFGMLIYALDDGVLGQDATTFMIVVGVIFAVLYLLVRFYRWFIVEKHEIADIVFAVLKDGIYIASLIFLFSFINLKTLPLILEVQTYFNLGDEAFMINLISTSIMDLVLNVITFLILTSLMRKMIRFLPFNNYKKNVYSKINGGYIALFVFAILFSVMGVVVMPIINSTFDMANIVPTVIGVVLDILPYLLVMIAVCLLGSVEDFHSTEIKLKLPEVKVISEDTTTDEPATADATEE